MEEAFYLLELISSEFIWKLKKLEEASYLELIRLSLSESSTNRGGILIAGAHFVRAFTACSSSSALISGSFKI